MRKPAVSTVLMTADAVGGVWTYAIDLARALAARGVRTTLATMGPAPTEGQRRVAADVPGLVLEVSTHTLEWQDDPWSGVDAAGEWLLELERRHTPDVVHLNGYAHAALELCAPRLVLAHSCVCSWWLAVHGEEAPARYEEYRRRVREGLLAADAVAAPTRAMAAAVVRHHGPLPEPVVIPNGVRLPDFHAAVKAPFVLAAGRLWDAAKDLATLQRAAAGLEWPVRVAGEGGAAASAAASELELLGRLDRHHLVGLMARAAIFAHPARYEPFGLAVLEAAASGCALVLGDIPSLRELWDDAALFVPPGDAAALHAALRALIADTPHRAELGARARRRARSYTLRDQADATLALYGQLVTAERHRGAAHRGPTPATSHARP